MPKGLVAVAVALLGISLTGPAPAAPSAAASAKTAKSSGASPAPSAQPGAVAPATHRLLPTSSHRPILAGLVAAAFLIVCALAGANDRPDGDPKPGPDA